VVSKCAARVASLEGARDLSSADFLLRQICVPYMRWWNAHESLKLFKG